MKKLYVKLIVLLLISISSYGQNINFPDANFKQALLNFDTNNDNEISIEEAKRVGRIFITKKNISSVEGIENFVNLKFLTLLDNVSLTRLDLSKNTQLTYLWCRNELTFLDVSNSENLDYLRLEDTKFQSIDLKNNTKLNNLHLRRSSLTSIDISNNKNLEKLWLTHIKLKSIDARSNSKLKEFVIQYCKTLESVNVPNSLEELILNETKVELFLSIIPELRNLIDLSIAGSSISSIDLSKNTKLSVLKINNTRLKSLDVRNCNLKELKLLYHNWNLKKIFATGQKFRMESGKLADVTLRGAHNLEFICVDQEYVEPIKKVLNESAKVDVSSNCSLDYSRIRGVVRYDQNGNGCDANDVGFSNLKFALSGSNGFTEIYPSNTGNYNAVVSTGQYFLFPVFENPEYFNLNPAPTFPPTPISISQNGVTVTRDFCVTPNGNHNDLEVMIVPSGRGARPGFKTSYLITYKNKGTTTQSGTVSLDYQQNILTLDSATPSVQTPLENNKLVWNFSNLRPFESRQIRVTLTVNKPTDTPAVNNGDVLSYVATVKGGEDKTPTDNSKPLNQTVVNSYDPNDKICLEGHILEPKNVGTYLHYMIRFENKGTADAVNIVVKDDIDTTKLAIKTLRPLQASHTFTTKISDKNKVEFIFNNINLPFDDANNDGYVLFKIKTKDNLKEGDKINNKAAIYFDFNPPVITDVETVVVKKKVVENPTFDDYFTLSPNPTKGNLVLTQKNTNIQVQYISIHDIAGRIVGFFNGNTRSFNLSYLYPNTYFMKAHTDKGILTTKFIKIN